MDLYHFPVSPYSHKVRLALHEKGLNYTSRPVLLFDPEQRRQFREVHPIGKVPLLVDGDQHIAESSIIIEYLDIHHEGVKFIPEDREEALQVRLKDRWVDQYLTDPAITIFFQMMRPEDKRDKTQIEKCQHRILSTYDFVEQSLKEKEAGQLFFHGNAWTLADLALLPSLRVANNVIPFERYEKVTQYFAEHGKRESLQAIVEEADEVMHQFIAALSK